VLDTERARQVPAATELDRVSRRGDLTAQAINIVVGSSIFVLPGIVAGQIGAWAPVAVIAASVGVFLVALSFADAAGRYREAGGPYRYASDAFGDYVGAQIGFLYWVVRAASSAAVVNVLITYLAEFWPSATASGWRVALFAVVVFGSAALNIVGTRHTVSVLNVFTVGKVLTLAALGVVAMVMLRGGVPAFDAVPAPGAWARATLLWIFSFGGFEATLITAAEARDPTRDGPRALIAGVGIVALLYVVLQWMVAATPGAATATRPLGEAARYLIGNPGATLIAVAALVSTSGHVPGSMFAASRLTYAMAERAALPASLARIHRRFRTPYVSILTFACVVWVLGVSGSFVWNASLSALARLIVYACTSLGVLRLGARRPSTFRVPRWVHVAALAFCGWLLSSSTWTEALAVGTVWAVGSLLWSGRGIWRRVAA